MKTPELIRLFTAEVLSEIDPDEAMLVADYSPGKAQGSVSRGPVGSGMEAGIVLLLPFVYKFFDKFMEQVSKRLADAASDALLKWLQTPQDKTIDAAAHGAVVAELVKAGMDAGRAPEVARAIMDTAGRHSVTILKTR